MAARRWTDADFEELSWHDVHVHSLEVRAGEHGAGELLLGLGYLLEWLPPEDGVHTFRIAPAELLFHGVTDLRVEVDWAAAAAALAPFALHGIRREAHEHTRAMGTHRYHLDVNWPPGEIRLVAAGFTQTLCGPPVRSTEQLLSTEERQGLPEGGVLEVATLDVRPGEASAFEAAFAEARGILAASPGHRRHELRRCHERADRYLLLVWWDALEDHTKGFRGSAAYRRWSALLHRFYDPFPDVEHYAPPDEA